MILADTSVWIDHLRRPDLLMLDLLGSGRILMHPLVIGELAAGSLADRERRLLQLDQMPQAKRAGDFVVRHLIEAHRLFGTGLSYFDVHLLASVRVTPHAQLWSRDKALITAATQLDVAFDPA